MINVCYDYPFEFEINHTFPVIQEYWKESRCIVYELESDREQFKWKYNIEHF